MDNFLAHILVVDDDDGIRLLVKKYLNENKYLVTTAESAEGATCLLYTSPSPRDGLLSRMPSSA